LAAANIDDTRVGGFRHYVDDRVKLRLVAADEFRENTASGDLRGELHSLERPAPYRCAMGTDQAPGEELDAGLAEEQKGLTRRPHRTLTLVLKDLADPVDHARAEVVYSKGRRDLHSRAF